MKVKAAIAFAAFIIGVLTIHTFSRGLISNAANSKTVAANTPDVAVNYYEVHRYYFKHNRPYYGHRKHYIAQRQDSSKTGIIYY